MSTDIDWQHELDVSFGVGEDVPVGHYVAAGHRAVRRRRVSAVVAGLAAAAVVGGIAWGVAPNGGPSSTDAPIATDPSRATSPTPAVEDDSQQAFVLPWRTSDPPARSGPAGLEIRPGAVVHERVDNLFPGKASESVALDISYQGDRWWMTLEWDEDGAAVSSSHPEDGLFATFDDFVIAEMKGGGMSSVPASADDNWIAGQVQWDGGDVRAREGVEVVQEVRDPVAADLPSVGLVLRKGDATTWMLVTDGGTSAAWTDEADSGWATFDEWLADQVALHGGTPERPSQGVTLVALDDGAVVAAQPGVVVLEQQADPDLRDYGTEGTGVVSAVALLEWKGQRWFVLIVQGIGDGPDSITTVAEAKAGGARTLDEFVAFMADRADEGGMR